ncbi:hypothetical protein L1F30_08675 [Simiduia sp. 21SJ11W-1]|uniref:hypothetical protein n=1 Tax=Simiduia sp. 21SJ11W-1 TaxID=2909669 RepID=UPI0020A0915F|nr:hypothetical protein [Simiduia sp. 21SJ11W-1]UTA49595.1 hypothetical protein L1F30_08675 [Simiduia sp. 21SJ11W-1]
MRLFLILASLLLASGLAPAVAEADSRMIIYTLPVKHRTPESIVAAIEPMLAPGGSLSSSGNKLIIKTTSQNFQELNLLIDELDTPTAQLLVSVRQEGVNNSQQAGVGVTGGIKRGTILLNGEPAQQKQPQEQYDRKTHVTVTRNSGWGNKTSSYQLRAQEGEPVFIQTGQQIPIQTRYGIVGGSTTEYHAVNSGISFVARLAGDGVILDITQQQQTPVEGNRIETQSLRTQVSGRLGEWISLGGTQSLNGSRERELTRYRSTQGQNDSNIYVKIDRY